MFFDMGKENFLCFSKFILVELNLALTLQFAFKNKIT